MSKIIIGAEAAKLAGLQIDLLQKYRQGHITDAHLEWFLGLKASERDVLVSGKELLAKTVVIEPEEKFELLVDLGVITVPENFENSVIWAGSSFSNPSRRLKPGDKFCVKAYWQTVSGMTTSKERMAFLETRKEGNAYLGAQGILLVYEQKRDLLPKMKWYASFDHEENLPISGGNHWVPSMDACSAGGFDRSLSYFGNVWNVRNAFLGFSDFVEPPLVA